MASGLETQVVGTSSNATLITSTAQWDGITPAGKYTMGKWISSADPAPAATITLRQQLVVVCPGLLLKLKANADDTATFSINGLSGSVNGWW